MLKFAAASHKRLIKVARQMGMGDTKVPRIHAQFIGSSNAVLIKPAGELDLTAFELSYYKGASGGAVSLYDLLGPARATVETGYAQRYDVHFVPEGSPLYPGLLIDLDDPKERKLVRKKKEAETPAK